MFRFQTLEIWQRSIEVAEDLLDLADELDSKRLYKFAEQLRAAALPMSNNIAEGSGSSSKKEFAYFTNVARRSAFENANMVSLFERRRYIEQSKKEQTLTRLDELCRMLSNFGRTLLAKPLSSKP